MKRLFTFDSYITPVVAKFLYYIILALLMILAVGYLIGIFQSIFAPTYIYQGGSSPVGYQLLIFVGTLVSIPIVRMLFEVIIVNFKIYELLTDIKITKINEPSTER